MRPLAVYAKTELALHRAAGCVLYDEKERPILDFYSGHGVISIGHSHPHFVARLTEQLQRLTYYSNAVDFPEQSALCELLGPLSGCADYDLFMVNSGAEAIENALKVASAVTQRTHVVAMRGSFHGRTSLAAQATQANRLCAPINTGLQVEFIALDDLEAAAAAITEQTAAVLIEGIQGVGGIWEGSSLFWQELARLCRERGALLIADEIQSGFGRTGQFFAFQQHGVQPDVICTAKGMGNGYPVAGTWVRQGLPVAMGSLGTTFGGNPMACTAARAVCEVLKAENLIERAADRGRHLAAELKQLPRIKAVRGRGLMLACDLEGDSYPLRSRLLHKHGILVGSASTKETLRLLPPLTISDDQCSELLDKLRLALNEI